MNFYYPIFGLFLIFIAWFTYERNKASKLETKKEADFWKRENDANGVRRVPLDSLEYVKVPDSILLSGLTAKDTDDKILLKCNEELIAFQSKRCFNLTGKTVTDIKMNFGPANIPALDEYDTNYTELVKLIHMYGTRLIDLNYIDDAIQVLEFGIDILTDISGNYKLLADLYIKKNQSYKLDYLLETADKLDSLNKNSIIGYINALKNN